MGAQRTGPCSSWCSGSDVAALPWVQNAASKAIAESKLTSEQVELICAESAGASSGILYELSGRMFTGECGPVTVRPLSRPTDIDTRGSLGAMGWFSAFGTGTSYGESYGVSAHYGSHEPPTIRLPYPVTGIELVKIDGTVIPPNEYELRDHQELVRIRPTAGFSPTARWGWPTSQINDLPDTEPGTFAITFMFGTPPPVAGLLAARKLGEYLALPQLGDSSRYPRRVTSVARQGVTATVTDIIDIVKTGATGIYEVDLFLRAHNPAKNQRQAAVWSPDLGRARRTANPTLT